MTARLAIIETLEIDVPYVVQTSLIIANAK